MTRKYQSHFLRIRQILINSHEDRRVKADSDYCEINEERVMLVRLTVDKLAN